MTLGVADKQGELFDGVGRFCAEALPEGSIYSFLARERDRLFPDAAFSDLFDKARGRRSVPPSVVATVMVLQRLEGLSDREAVERYSFDVRWRYAAGVGGYDGTGWTGFAHTVLVDMRERLRRSEDPDRIFTAALGAAREAGLIGRKRVVDSTPLYDAVATMDTVTLIRSAIRGLLKAADGELQAELAGAIKSGDTYASGAKPQIDWDDRAAREELVDSRAKDAYACIAILEGRELPPQLGQAARLLATVVGQDLIQGDEGTLRIERKVARDRVVSTVDPESRHGHKTRARSFEGYKGHVAIDPDAEIITATCVTPGNAGDASAAEELIADLLAEGDNSEPAKVYGDNAYGAGDFQRRMEDAGIDSRAKTQRPTAAKGLFPKDRFSVDLEAGAVTCPAGATAPIRRRRDGNGVAKFARACRSCPMRDDCTTSKEGRVITVGPNQAVLERARKRQQDPAWMADYRANRPKVERKIAHLMRRTHGGRRARVRGRVKVGADFSLLAAAVNLARLAALGAHSSPGGWSVERA